jgi:hypothetical protein
MKRDFMFLASTLVIQIILISCSKPISIPEPEPLQKTFKYKVMEYQTNKPIENAVLEHGYCTYNGFGCSDYRTVGKWYSDKNGDILIRPGQYGITNMIEFNKENYWTKTNSDPVLSTPTLDSAVVRLFPLAWLQIHFKNETIHNSALDLFIELGVLHDSIPYNYFGPRYDIIHPVNNIDTTIIYNAFGFFKNIVKASLDSSGIRTEFTPKHSFWSKNDTLKLEIVF